MTGLAHAKGDFVFLIDVDLEEEPELLGRFWKEMQSQKGSDVVYGVQAKRKGGIFEKLSGALFYKLHNFFSDVKVPSNLITARLFTYKAKNMIIAYKERELCLGCIYHDIGLVQVPIFVTKHSHSKTTYSLSRKISIMLNAIVSFSNKPLIYIFNIGLLITCCSSIYVLNLIFQKLYYDIPVDGWASVMVSIWFFGGLIILFIGIIGVYLAKIFSEVKARPYTLIKQIYESKEN